MVSDKKSVSKLYLRTIIEDELAPTIELHRSSREQQDKSYDRPSGSTTDDEIDDFILSNPLFDEETVEQLIDPGFLGFGFANKNALSLDPGGRIIEEGPIAFGTDLAAIRRGCRRNLGARRVDGRCDPAVERWRH